MTGERRSLSRNNIRAANLLWEAIHPLCLSKVQETSE
uniref:Uncharacterized protein n=1 Tax=Anguilla anguilla TaxID=7936 RepID=A0A0E9VSN0_ANGAN